MVLSQKVRELSLTLCKVLEEPTTHTGGYQMVVRSLRSKWQDRSLWNILSLGKPRERPIGSYCPHFPISY